MLVRMLTVMWRVVIGNGALKEKFNQVLTARWLRILQFKEVHHVDKLTDINGSAYLFQALPIECLLQRFARVLRATGQGEAFTAVATHFSKQQDFILPYDQGTGSISNFR